MLLWPGYQQATARAFGDHILDAFAGLLGTDLDTFGEMCCRDLGVIANFSGFEPGASSDRLRSVRNDVARLRSNLVALIGRDPGHRPFPRRE